MTAGLDRGLTVEEVGQRFQRERLGHGNFRRFERNGMQKAQRMVNAFEPRVLFRGALATMFGSVERGGVLGWEVAVMVVMVRVEVGKCPSRPYRLHRPFQQQYTMNEEK